MKPALLPLLVFSPALCFEMLFIMQTPSIFSQLEMPLPDSLLHSHYLLGRSIQSQFPQFFSKYEPEVNEAYSTDDSNAFTATQSLIVGLFSSVSSIEFDPKRSNLPIKSFSIENIEDLSKKPYIYFNIKEHKMSESRDLARQCPSSSDYFELDSFKNEQKKANATFAPLYTALKETGYFPGQKFNVYSAETQCKLILEMAYYKKVNISSELIDQCEIYFAHHYFVQVNNEDFRKILTFYYFKELANNISSDKEESKKLVTVFTADPHAFAAFASMVLDQNGGCILDEYQRKYGEDKGKKEKSDEKMCISTLKPTSNLLIYIDFEEKWKPVKIFYNGESIDASLLNLERMEDFVFFVNRNEVRNLEELCGLEKGTSFVLVVLMLAVLALFFYSFYLFAMELRELERRGDASAETEIFELK